MMKDGGQIMEMTPLQVHDAMKKRSIVLIDVREPHEYSAERIHGALLYPLSTFDPLALPRPDGCRVVFHCGSGKRSMTAIGKCLQHGISHLVHMPGGIQAWKRSALPTVTLDPTSGKAVDRK
jgi:rhodanese-related sulfurtransferase